jgi:integrator complex subunit 1
MTCNVHSVAHMFVGSLCVVEGCELIDAIEDAFDKSDDERQEALLCGAVKHLKANRAKPDPAMCLALMVLAKTQPTLFHSDVVTEVSFPRSNN